MAGQPASVHAVHPPTHHSSIETSVPQPRKLESPAALSCSRPLAPELSNVHPADLPEAIEEENEESASDSPEPITPTSDAAPRTFQHSLFPSEHPNHHKLAKPLIVNTEATPPSTPSQQKNSSSGSTSPRRSNLKSASKSLRSLFRRPNSSNGSEDAKGHRVFTNLSEFRAADNGIYNALRKGSVSSASHNSHNSPTSSQSHTPPSPGSPSSTLNGGLTAMLSTSTPPESAFAHKKPTRASTGFSLRNRSKVMFGSTPKPERPEHRIRSPSLSDIQNQPERPGFSIPAVSGAGLKARRMSATLPDGFSVDTCELGAEYVSSSRLPGRRGKEVGKGATATVKIMYRKHSTKGTPYAVKEFRKRGSKENEEEYVKKVKSEFSIANSLHHPNIVQTFRLCTQGDRWNHVMEYCPHGEVFSLVQKNYLQQRDNLCFFKQVIRGVGHLHENGIAHRDIKLENLLLSDDGHIKITDFGVSEVFSGIHPGLRSAGGVCGKNMGEVRQCAPGICGSLPYIAPEVLAKKGSYDPRPLDIWSCAIVYLTLHYHGNPWPAAERKYTNYARFIDGWDKFIAAKPDGLVSDDRGPSCGPLFRYLNNSGLKRLLLRMLHPDPEKRYTIKDVMNDRFYKTIECCSPLQLGDPSEAVGSLDVSGKGSCKAASKLMIQKIHRHLPPEKKYLPQHSFEIGEGY